MRKKIILSLLLVIGLSGSLLFFPIKIGTHFTCLFHYKQSGKTGSAQSVEQAGFISADNSGQLDGHPTNEKLHYYLSHFSFIWWGSLGLSVISFLYLAGILGKKSYYNTTFLRRNTFYES